MHPSNFIDVDGRGREGEREGGREGGREIGKEGGREGGREREGVSVNKGANWSSLS